MRALVLLSLTLGACSGGVIGGGKPPSKESEAPKTDPDIEVEETSVDFGAIGYGEFVPGSITVNNIGGDDLIISSIAVDAPFQISPQNVTLEAGASTRITLNVQLVKYGEASSNVIFNSNDPDEPTITVPVMAVAIADVDGDGHDLIEAGGDDCDDTDPKVYPGADEIWYDGVDENCDGADDYDQDGDGYETDAFNSDPARGGGDCQDVRSDYYPGAPDVPYDNRDTNCKGDDDWDYDGDGYQTAQYGVGSDCDDADDTINRDGYEGFNGKDDNCDGTIDNKSAPEYSAYFISADKTGDQTGYSTAVGDFDGDGYAEVVVGAPYTSGNSSPKGAVGIFDGQSIGDNDLNYADGYIEGNAANDRIGDFVTMLGDFNGDGVNDLAIGGSNVSSGSGAVYLISGDDVLRSRTTLSDSFLTLTGASGSYLGRGIGTSVDLDADGMDELVPMGLSGGYNAVGLLYGSGALSPTLDVTQMDCIFTTTGTSEPFYRNAPVGADMDGDGYEDLVLSDGNADEGGKTDNGAIWILWGDATQYHVGGPVGITNYATTVVSGTSNSLGMGWASQPGEDWDGDGDAELWMYAKSDGIYVVEGRARSEWNNLGPSDASVHYTWGSSSADVTTLRQIGDWDSDGVSEMMAYLADTSSSIGVNEVFSSTIQSGEYTEKVGQTGSLLGGTDYGNANVGYGTPPLAADIEADGDADIVVGDPAFDSNAGEAYVLINRMIE